MNLEKKIYNILKNITNKIFINKIKNLTNQYINLDSDNIIHLKDIINKSKSSMLNLNYLDNNYNSLDKIIEINNNINLINFLHISNDNQLQLIDTLSQSINFRLLLIEYLLSINDKNINLIELILNLNNSE